MNNSTLTFIQNQEYYFIKNKTNNENKIEMLGKFIKYVDLPLWGDWLLQAQAIFENKTISKGQYYMVLPITNLEHIIK